MNFLKKIANSIIGIHFDSYMKSKLYKEKWYGDFSNYYDLCRIRYLLFRFGRFFSDVDSFMPFSH